MVIMKKCSNGGSSNTKPVKTWKHGIFTVNAHVCGNCKTEYIDYLDKKGKTEIHIKTPKKEKATSRRKKQLTLLMLICAFHTAVKLRGHMFIIGGSKYNWEEKLNEGCSLAGSQSFRPRWSH